MGRWCGEYSLIDALFNYFVAVREDFDTIDEYTSNAMRIAINSLTILTTTYPIPIPSSVPPPPSNLRYQTLTHILPRRPDIRPYLRSSVA